MVNGSENCRSTAGLVNEVIVGDSRHIPLPDESVHLCVTSPPYW